MILAVYSALLGLALIVGAPWWLARMAVSGRYRAGLGQRLGLVPAEVREAAAGRQVVWLHAVSVGEVMAATELVRELRRALPGWVIAVSTTTETGQALARERFGRADGEATVADSGAAAPVFYLPLDFGFIVRRYLRALRPRLMVLMESELWPNLMNECERAGVSLAVVNTRVSDRSLPRYLWLKRLWRPLLGKVELFLAQSEENARRVKAIGALEERVRVSGNLKYDLRAAGETAMTRALRERLQDNAKVLVAGSVLEGEEAMLLGAWRRVAEAVPGAVMVLAPRRKERFGAVAALAESDGFRVIQASEFAHGPVGDLIQPGSVVLLDTIGDLASVYSLGRVALVGGSLVAAGGHNPLEPARFGVPVVMGTSCENFREIVEAMRGADAIRVVDAEGLAAELIELLTDENAARTIGERGRKVFEAEAGATRRTVDALLELVGSAA